MEWVASEQATRRKARSEARLKAEGVPIHPRLPVIADETEVRPRTREEIAYRALCLLPVAGRGCGLEPEVFEQFVAQFELNRHFTPEERAYVQNEDPPEQAVVKFCWRFEAAWVLLWALGYVEEGLSRPEAVCDVQRAYAMALERSPEQFLADAKLMPLSEILDLADLTYRYAWATRNAWLNHEEEPAGLSTSVVQERHYAFSWLADPEGTAWDEVSPDT